MLELLGQTVSVVKNRVHGSWHGRLAAHVSLAIIARTMTMTVPPSSNPISSSYASSASMTRFAVALADAGFWPVMRRPSTSVCEVKGMGVRR